MQTLKETQAWIATGGVASPATAAPLRIIPLPNLMPPAPSDSESEVGGSDMELPTQKRLLSKVQWADDVEHVLDKGACATMPVTCQGWEIFVDVSSGSFPYIPN